MSGGGCQVPLSGDAGTGLCGWETEGRTPWCAAHRRRRRLTGDFQAHRPVLRKPSRRGHATRVRQGVAAQRAQARDDEHGRQMDALRAVRRTVTAVLT